MALDRKIIAVFSLAFACFVGLMIQSYCSREYVETIEGEVIQAYSKMEEDRKFPGLRRYEYYLRIRTDRGTVTMDVDYELFRIFVVKRGVVVLDMYRRPLSGLCEYEITSWTASEERAKYALYNSHNIRSSM